MSSFSWIMYGLSFLELFPQFDCQIGDATQQDCSSQQICTQYGYELPYTVNYTNHTSLHNWVEQVDLTCRSSEQIAFIGSMFFIGWCCTLLWVPVLADKKGRKWIYFGSILGTAIVILWMLFAKSLWAIYFLMFMGGVLTSGRYTTGYVYGNEFCPSNWQVVWGTVQALEDGSITLLISLYYDFVSNQYFVIFVIALAYASYSLIVVGLFAPESPLWQIKMG